MSKTQVRNIDQDADFKDKLIKLIPAEVIAAYMAIDGIISSMKDEDLAKFMSVFVAVVLLAAIPFYLRKFYSVANVPQIIFTMGSFIVWLYTIGGPFKYIEYSTGPHGSLTLHRPPIASIILILWTLFIPFFVSPSPESANAENQ